MFGIGASLGSARGTAGRARRGPAGVLGSGRALTSQYRARTVSCRLYRAPARAPGSAPSAGSGSNETMKNGRTIRSLGLNRRSGRWCRQWCRPVGNCPGTCRHCTAARSPRAPRWSRRIGPSPQWLSHRYSFRGRGGRREGRRWKRRTRESRFSVAQGSGRHAVRDGEGEGRCREQDEEGAG